jgi:hypothetical protein
LFDPDFRLIRPLNLEGPKPTLKVSSHLSSFDYPQPLIEFTRLKCLYVSLDSSAASPGVKSPAATPAVSAAIALAAQQRIEVPAVGSARTFCAAMGVL